jgi:hypothetical protein
MWFTFSRGDYCKFGADHPGLTARVVRRERLNCPFGGRQIGQHLREWPNGAKL